ncbi:disulfide bond formation protein B [Phaeovibrio sulfidiphilus]|uniref:Disulfide bond formation protein B n=1 Tax=Phaeovibrio sulfidiphilus TaxID=1220600 RepID=A0A8J7CWC1_9PROT|nr:disulfide bond formation protein B [Phaeovibrio sulfidiphilus]MBE1237306.1 disulfide bond formation protein B [Phaeovibrio sulfidiphilus]
MTRLARDTRDPTRTLAALALLLATAVLGAALVMEKGLGYPVCDLCLYQRLPWYAVLGLSALAVMGRTAPETRVRLLVASALITGAGAVLAFYHVGVELHWWAGDALCAASSQAPIESIEALTQALDAPGRRAARCDDTQFLSAGVPITLAQLNAAGSLVSALGLGIALRALGTRAPKP